MDYSRTDIIKVKDLEPAADGKPQALYECNICGDHIVKYVSNAEKSNGRCRKCSNLRYECVSEVDLEQIENIIEGGV